MNEPTRDEVILKAVTFELRVFADSLVPSKDFEKVGNAAFQKVTESIKKDPAFSVNRCIVAGSYGKKTSVLVPDIDAVVFLNNKQLPLTDEIEAIIDLLKIKANEFGIIPSSITKSSKTVKLEFYSGVEMDLLPACIFSQDPYEQYLKVLDCIKSYPENYFIYSSSLAEIQKQFLKDQPGPTHQLIRLLKYWYKSLPLDVDIYGGSYLMEILCVVVCNDGKTPKSLIENFKAVLQKVATIDSLKVAFLLEKTTTDKLRWTLLSNPELDKHKDLFSPFILKRPRFIIDPSNPFNDLFNPKNLTEKVVIKLKECAVEMLDRVEMLGSIENDALKTITAASDTDVEVKLHIDRIFEPHSMCLHDKYEELPVEIVFHVDFKCKDFSKIISIDPKSPTFFVENKEAKKISKRIFNDLLFLVRGKVRLVSERKDNKLKKRYIFTNGIPDVPNINDVEDAVQTLIRKNDFEAKSSSSAKEHEKCDVTLYVPYNCNGINMALRFSMKWKKKDENVNNCDLKKWGTGIALASLAISAITVTLMITSGRFRRRN